MCIFNARIYTPSAAFSGMPYLFGLQSVLELGPLIDNGGGPDASSPGVLDLIPDQQLRVDHLMSGRAVIRLLVYKTNILD
jgi:hypothetical protein